MEQTSISSVHGQSERYLPDVATDIGRGLVQRHNIVKNLVGIAHFVIIAVVIFVLSYLLGREVLVGPLGNDSLLHLANTEWFDRYLPNIPNWFPLQGGGISIQRSYPILPYVLVSVIGRLADITLVQSYRLVSLISVPAAAISIYLFCLAAVKNRTIGLIAAILYLLSPISWSWILVQGYLTTTVAIITLPLTLLCFVRYLDSLVDGQIGLRRRLWMVGLLVSFSITVLAHVVVGAAAISGMALYALFYAIVNKSSTRTKTFLMGIKSGLVCGLVASLVLAFWAIPMLTYARATNPHGTSRMAESSIARPSLDEIFGVKSLDVPEWGWFRDSSMPAVVGVLFLVGMVASVFSSRKVLAIAMTGAAAIGYTLVPEIAISLTNVFSLWPAVFSVRSFMVLASIVFPIVAAYGAWAGPMALTAAVGAAVNRGRCQKIQPSGLVDIAWKTMASLLALLIAGIALYSFRNISSVSDDIINYGTTRAGLNPKDFWGTGTASGSLVEQLHPNNWPQFEITDGDPKIEEVARVASFLPQKELQRVDVSPSLGMYAQSLAVQSGASQINTYIWNANLMWPMWGYQQNVSFIASSLGTEYGTPTTLNEVADWFGTEYVYLSPIGDQIDTYSAAGWERIVQEDSLELWHYPEAPGLATLSTRPKILAISSDLLGAYELVFRAANRGAIPYLEAFLVKGKENIDSYSIETLQEFDALFLEGYSYRDSNNAWSMLDQYVRQGGALFIDTGWQWGIPEWEFDVAPSVLPVENLRWTELGTPTEYWLESQEIVLAIDPSRFAPLVWNGGPWGISTTSKEQIRPWGDTVLSANGQPLIVAGRYGEGRVVWSGMNLVAHASDNENDAEIELLNLLIQWLLAGTSSREFAVDVSRIDPDRVEFSLNVPSGEGAALLWREAYYPAWHAYVETASGEKRELSIHAGGPGFMLILMDDVIGESAITLKWETPAVERIGIGISILAMAALGAYIIDGVFLNGVAFNKLAKRFRLPAKKKPQSGSVAWLQDDGNVSISPE